MFRFITMSSLKANGACYEAAAYWFHMLSFGIQIPPKEIPTWEKAW